MVNNNYNIVEVVWVDAEEHGEIGWNDIKSQLRYAKKPSPQMKSVGYEIYSDKDHISLLSSIGVKDSSTVEKIPVAFIKSVTVLVPRKLSN